MPKSIHLVAPIAVLPAIVTVTKSNKTTKYSKYENQLIPSENHDGFFYALFEKN